MEYIALFSLFVVVIFLIIGITGKNIGLLELGKNITINKIPLEKEEQNVIKNT